MASFFPEKLFNFVQCVLCNLDDFSSFLPRGKLLIRLSFYFSPIILPGTSAESGPLRLPKRHR